MTRLSPSSKGSRLSPGASIPVNSITEAQLTNSNSFGLGVLRTARAKYSFAVDGGAISTITLATNATIPDNAVLMRCIVNSTTAVTSGGAATIAFGTSAGSSSNSLMVANAVAGFSADAFVNSNIGEAGEIKMTAAGQITITIEAFALTAGVIEIT